MSPRSKEASARMRAASRDALLAAARRLFAEQGYFNTKIVEIARQANMSPGNVYLYFAGKEALLKAVLADGFETLQASLEQAAGKQGTSTEKMISLLEAFMDFERERSDFTRVLLSLFAHGGAPLVQQLGFDLEQIGGGYHQSLLPVLAQAEEEGLAGGLDPGVAAMFFFAFFNGLSITYGREWLDIPSEVVRDAVLRLVLFQPPA